MAFGINLKDIKKGGFSRKAIIMLKDQEHYVYGTVRKIDLVDAFYSQKTSEDQGADEGATEQLKYSCDMKTLDENQTLKLNIMTGTVFNKEPQKIKFKSRGNKVMVNVYNQCTECCLRFGLMSNEELELYDDDLSLIMEERLGNYNSRKENELIKFKAKLLETTDAKKRIDIYTIVKID